MFSFLPLFSSGPLSAAESSTSVVRGNLRVQALAPNLLRMEYSPTTRFVDEPSVAVIGRRKWQGVTPSASEKDGWLVVSTGKVTMRYKLGAGKFGPTNLQIQWNDDAGSRAWKPGDKDDRNLGGVPGDMGGRSMVPVTDPGPLSRNGYYWLDDSRTALFDKATQWVKPRPEKDSQDWYFLVYGDDYAGALGSLAKLVGPVPMLPRYVFGSWFGSRCGYSAEQWKAIVDQFREERLPLDMLVLDSDSWGKRTWKGYDFDREQMPDPKEFFAWMKQRGVKVTMNEHYGEMTRDSESRFDAARLAAGLPETAQQVPHNLADKRYAQFFMDVLHKPVLDMGLAFWWQDGAAGAVMDGLDPYLWTRHVEYTGSQRITGKRSTVFCRLGSAVGSHRYGIYFTGDLHGIWESLPVMIPATIRGGNQLVPYMNNLCGGVFVVNLPQELYQRWVQFGAFSPVLWFHGLWGLRLPWEYGAEGEATYRRFVGLRYALLPYIYTYSRVAHDTGLPLVRGMYLEYPRQESSYASDQQYMFGKELLVAPITKPGNGKPVERDVFLPAGDAWVDYFTGDIYEGGRKLAYECPIDRMPLLVRAGSIIPLAAAMDYSDQKPLDALALDVYAGSHAAQFKLYEDDGISLDYRKGQTAWTPITFEPAAKEGDYSLSVGPTNGHFADQPARRRYLVRIHGLLAPRGVRCNGVELPEGLPSPSGRGAGGEGAIGWAWDPATRTTTVRIPFSPLLSGEGAAPAQRVGLRGVGVRDQLVLDIRQVGTFAQAVVVQKALNLRAQVRQAKRLMKLKHADLLAGADVKKPPRVIRTTEAVEWELTAIINQSVQRNNSAGLPDFQAMRQRVVDALTDRPFESHRRIADVEPETIEATKKIENARFTAEEIARITRLLRGSEVPAALNPPL